MNPVKKVKKAIRNRKRKKRWKEMKHDLCYLSMDVLNVMSHAMAMPDASTVKIFVTSCSQKRAEISLPTSNRSSSSIS